MLWGRAGEGGRIGWTEVGWARLVGAEGEVDIETGETG